MEVTSGKLVIIDLGKETAQYFWQGTKLDGVESVFVYRGYSVTLHVSVCNNLPIKEMKDYGIKVKVRK